MCLKKDSKGNKEKNELNNNTCMVKQVLQSFPRFFFRLRLLLPHRGTRKNIIEVSPRIP